RPPRGGPALQGQALWRLPGSVGAGGVAMATVARYGALDVHKHSVMVAALDAAQQGVLAPRKLSLERVASWASEHLTMSAPVVLAATTNAWTLYDQLAPLVQEVQRAHPLLLKRLSSARVKTD